MRTRAIVRTLKLGTMFVALLLTAGAALAADSIGVVVAVAEASFTAGAACASKRASAGTALTAGRGGSVGISLASAACAACAAGAVTGL